MNREKIKRKLISIIKLDLFQELIFAGIGCLFFFILYPFFPKRYWNKTYRNIFILILILSFLLILLIFNQANPKRNFFKINYKRNIILFSIFNFAMLYFLLFRTSFGINGISGDNFYRSAYITQMAYSGYPQDFAYKGLSAFMAPLYWYFLALLARLFQIKPYKMLKIGLLIIYYIFPIILYEIWKKIYNKKMAFIVTILSFFVFYDTTALDHFIGYMLIVPFFLYYYENFACKKFTRKDYIIGGFLGSIVFCTFFFYFLIIPIYYLISLIQNKDEFRDNFKHILYISLSLLLFSSWFWVPYLKDIITIGFESHQQKYYSGGLLSMPFKDYFTFGVGGAIQFFGLIYIIRKYKVSRDIKILGNIILSVYILYLIGFIGMMINNPINHGRFLRISSYALIISSSIFYVRFFYFIANNDNLVKYKINLNIKQIEIYILIFIIASQNYRIFTYISNSSSYEAALEEDYPSKTIDIFKELDYEDKVFLTNEWRVAAYIPIYLFLLPNPYFSHPSALYNERVEFLVELSECDSSKKFHKKIINNKFGPIHYFFLDVEDNSTKLVFDVAVEKFPDGREYYEIEFERELFEDENLFEEIIIDGKLIYRTKKI